MSTRDDDDYYNAWEFVTKLSPDMLGCRGGRSHDFIGGEQLFGSESHGIVHTETRCSRGCQVVKVEDYDVARGYYVQHPHYRYPPGYLVKAKDNGPIHPTDIAAATRLVRYYTRKGIATPKPARKRRSA